MLQNRKPPQSPSLRRVGQFGSIFLLQFHGRIGSGGVWCRDTKCVPVDHLADLVLLDENPLANIENVRKINSVMLRGQWLNRPALGAMINEVKTKVQEYKKRE